MCPESNTIRVLVHLLCMLRGLHEPAAHAQRASPASGVGSKMAVRLAPMVLAKSPVLTTPEKRKLGASVLERIGNTPLLRLEKVGKAYPEIGFYAKAEWFNPGGSVKDRAAHNM